jgi:hypothetical protein
VAQPKERTLYRVEYGGSTYYATGADAFNALRRCVEHDDQESSYAHQSEIEEAVLVEEAGTAGEDVLAWGIA